MAMLPGWNSLDAVGSIGHSLHVAAMVVLALLVVAEGLALVYDDRKYALIGAAERDITISRDQEALAVTERHHNEIAALRRELEETQRQQASLGLTTTGQQTLLYALSAFPGQQIEIVSIPGDLEAQQFANDFASVAQQSGWIATSVQEAALTTNPSGIEVLYREPPMDEVPPPALAALVDVLVDLRILPARSVTICEEVASEVIRLAVGARSATAELHSSLSQKEPPSVPNDSEPRNGATILDTLPEQ
jgi:hypothetical protein